MMNRLKNLWGYIVCTLAIIMWVFIVIGGLIYA